MEELAIVTTEATEPEVEKTSRVKSFTVNHPRTAKVVGILAITGATLGAMSWWKAHNEDSETTEDNSAEDAPFDASSETA
jgi:hypothetical protein